MTGDGEQGRAERVDEALQRYEAPLLRYAARITGDADRARDVVQETFLRLWQVGDGEPRHVAQWLFTVCRNRALDIRRKEKRMSTLAEPHSVAATGRDLSPPAVVEQRETAGVALGLLANLPGNQQEVVRLKFQNGFSYRQIAAIMGLSVTNVGFLIHKAMTALRQKLNPPISGGHGEGDAR